MLFKWLDASEATQVGTTLAEDFFLQSTAGSPGTTRREQRRPQGEELHKFLQKFLQQVDRAVQPLKLNVFKRAKLANSFKWRLLEKGVEQEVVDELTQALVLRLTGTPAGASAGAQASGASGRRIRARDAQALHARGSAALARGAFAEALECYQELVSIEPRDAVARNALGTAYAQLARYAEAEAELRRAIGIRPAFPEAHFNLAGVLQSTGRFNESEMPLRRALKLKPSYLDARISLGMSCVLLGRLAEARDCYEKALRAAPRNTQALVGIGQIDALEGRFAEAEVAYRRALEIDPNSSYAWAALAGLRRMTPADAGWVKHAEEIAGSNLTPLDEATLRFAIGKYYDDVGDYAHAFRSYQRANELHKLRAEPYDRDGRTRFVDDLVRVYTRESLAVARAAASESARPVLVVGMPRSGTSLVEQIIASHPQACGAGELNFWQIAVRQHETTLRRELLAEPLRRKLAQEYLKVLTGHSADALRVVDKAPVNADYLGLIHSVFPRAHFLYLRRDPIDTCLSCYFQQFPPSRSMNYTMELSDLVHYYREHRRLVDHWRSVLPAESFLDVPYAELTADQEKWTRRILEFIGLPWDERCLEFHKTTRAVTTASVWQVRQKMYRTSVERWRHYEKFIGPLRSLRDLPA
jgi:tetratricopeptide (TPR) repeat protein